MAKNIHRRRDADPGEGIKKYGDATFADPSKNKYPIDTPGRIKAAWAYIHQPRNAEKYTVAEVRTIKARVPESAPNDFAPVLLYDGVCGFCSRVVQFVLRVERRNTLRFAALQGKYGQEIMAQNRVLQGVDSMAWVEPDTPASRATVFVRSEAVLRLLAYLGMPWSLGLIGGLLPVGMRDRAYDWVARRRLRLVRGAPACSLPSPSQHRRFLE